MPTRIELSSGSMFEATEGLDEIESKIASGGVDGRIVFAMTDDLGAIRRVVRIKDIFSVVEREWR